MSLTDPIADFLTRVRNAIMAGNHTVAVPSSKLKLAIAKILQEEGFIKSFEEFEVEGKPQKSLHLELKYVGERRDRKPDDRRPRPTTGCWRRTPVSGLVIWRMR
jgi:small subunit ribosomal protein S8